VWTEIDVDRRLTAAELQLAAGKTFGIASERVRVVKDLVVDIAALDPVISLVIEHRPQPGDFPERVAFVMWDGNLIDMVGPKEDSTESYSLLIRLAGNLHASLIVPDTGIDPYSGLVIEPSGDVYRVGFDEEVMDESGGVSLPARSDWVHVPELSNLPQRHLLSS